MPAVERLEISMPMWAALKTHIMKQREKKKQEQEADEAVERLRREQEMRKKQNDMTAGDIKEELNELAKKCEALKEEKHELFQFLKRILFEDDKRRNEENKEANEMMQMNHHYQNQGVPVAAAPNLYMITQNRLMTRNPVMYKVGTSAPPPQQNGAVKRQRSPSPPSGSYPQGYAYKTHVTAYGQTFIPHPASQYAAQEQAKHLAGNYHVPHIQQPGFVTGIPQPMEHPSSKPPDMQEGKYYIQAGGISSGFPIRTQPQPSSHFQPPTSHSVTAPCQVPLRKEEVMRRNMNNEAHR